MTTVAQLAAQPYQEFGYVLFVEGWRVAWTDRVELAGSGVSSWIGTGEGDRVVALGLEPPASVRLEIGILDTGLPVNDSLTLTLIDRDGHLVAFARDEAGDLVAQRLAPTDDPAPSTLYSNFEGEVVDLHGRHINGEAIGAAGERRLYQVLPGSPLPGYDHAAVDGAIADLRPTTVLDAARWFEGRPAALYLIRKDIAAGTWPSWQDQADSGVSRIWWGTCRSLSAQSRAWTLELEGPSSWLARTLNANRPATWRPLRPIVELSAKESKLAISYLYRTSAGAYLVAGSSAYQAADVVTSGLPAKDMAAEIEARLLDVAAIAGPDCDFSFYGGEVSFDDAAAAIRVADNNGGSAYGGTLVLRAHRKVWITCGWDLDLQVRPPVDISTPQEVGGRSGGPAAFDLPWLDAAVSDPGPGYQEAWFTTCPLGMSYADAAGKVDNDGDVRVYNPLYSGGNVAVLYPDAGIELELGEGLEGSFYIEGQLARPPADHTLDAGVCDATGFLAVRGMWRDSIDAEPEERWRLAKVSWRQDSTTTTIKLADSRAIVWCERWLDQQAFGAPAVDDVWAAKGLEYVPAALFGYNLEGPDRAHAVLLRLLLATGTASWAGTEGDPDAEATPGDNAHPDATTLADDLEIADMGLGIPAEMIDWGSFKAAAAALPGGLSGSLNATRIAVIGPVDSLELIESILKPRAWCFSLVGGRYGVWARGGPLDVDDVEVSLTQSDIAGEPDELPPSETVDFRPLEPIDLIEVTWGANQLAGETDGDKRLVIRALDPRAAQRRGNAKIEINGRTLLATGGWSDEMIQLWGDRMARWYAEPWALVTAKIQGHKARSIWPGTLVRYTSPWPATRESVYGMTARLGRVISVERDTQTLAATLQILVASGDPTTLRRFAPIARLLDDVATVEARHDEASRTLCCYADAFGTSGANSDVRRFAEPSWSSVGGDALVYVWSSWDGVTWEKTGDFLVESIDEATSTIVYQAGSLNGTIWERRYTLLMLAPYEDQDPTSWVRSVFGVLCDSDGKFGAGNLTGFSWVEG